MRPADLLAIAASAAPQPSARQGAAADADLFSRALRSESGRVTPVGDDRCGVPCGETGASTIQGMRGERADELPGFVRPVIGARPERGAVDAWRTFLQGLRESGLFAGAARQGETAEGKLSTLTALQAPAEGAEPKPAPASAETGAFISALQALQAAITTAVQDPAANPAEPGQLPAAVQTALDAAVAAAPPALQPRIQAFAERLTQRLTAAMSGDTAEAKGSAVAAAATESAADGQTRSVAQAVLAALEQSGQGQTPVIPDLERRATLRAAVAETTTDAAPKATDPAAPAATSTDASARSSGQASNPAQAQAAPTDAAEALPVATDPAAATADASVEAAPTPAAAAAPTQAHAATLSAVRGSPELVAQLAANIVRKLEGRTTRFEMELNPAEMGRVDVRLSIDKDGRVAAQMAFDNPLAAADMRGRADDLRRQLEQAGFQVASEDLSFAERDKGQQFDRSARGEADPDAARERAFREGERNARLAEDAGRLANRTQLGLDMRV